MNNSPVNLTKDIQSQVISRINHLQKENGLSFPKNYSYVNAIQSALLILQDVEDKNGNKALQVCTRNSIANFLIDMSIQGLSVVKKQCYPIVYGKELKCVRSYFGNLAILKRINGVKNVYSEVIRQGEDFKIGFINGLKFIERHEMSLETLDNEIIGAYAVIETDAGNYTEIMTAAQIKISWSKTKMKTNNVTKEFADQMAKRTVINRATKYFINTCDDSDLLIKAINESSESERDDLEIAAEIVEENQASEILKPDIEIEKKEPENQTELKPEF